MHVKLSLTYSAYKEMERIPGPPLRKIGKKILALAEDPRPPWSAVLEGQGGCLFITESDWYILYHVDENNRSLTILGVVDGPIQTLH
ncbi:MAG: hypothetical protein O2794_01285 [bacterium]|nr:hypothetical protein [bacterium]